MKTLHVFTIATTAGSFFNGQFEFLTQHGHDIHMVSSAADVDSFCEQNHVRFFPIEIPRRIDIKGDIKAIIKLTRIIRKEKYDAVFGHTPKGALLAMIAAFITRIPLRVYYRHGLIYTTTSGLRRTIFKLIEQLTALLSTNIVNVSPSLSVLAVKDHLNSDGKQCTIGAGTCGGIDAIHMFNPSVVSEDSVKELRHTLGIKEDSYVVGFCGRLCCDKGIIELVEGFKLFQKKHCDKRSYLLLVGQYDTRDILPQNIKEEIETNLSIIAPGRVSHERLPIYYSLMDVFAFPSYREGFGMTVLEASAMELPILVSRSHGCVDSIRENETGLYIDISPEDIADKLAEMQNTDLRLMFGLHGRKMVLGNFDWSVMWPQIEKLYNKLQNSRPADSK